MGSTDRYIFRLTATAFVVVLISLTAAVWLTQALRGIDIMTGRGQTVFVFLALTTLVIPYLLLVIAPLALLVAIAYVLNRLATDSEIIVLNACGLNPWRLFRPFFYVAAAVSVLVFAISAFIAPHSLRVANLMRREIATDVVSNVLQTGQFLDIEPNLTLRVRERQPGGLLSGIFVDDRRDPKERTTIIADRGSILKNERGAFLVLEDGTLQRSEPSRRDPAMVAFDSYAFDMSKFASAPKDIIYTVRERYLWELLSPDPADPLFKAFPGQFRADLHERLSAPLYPFVFAMMTFAFLGAPRTTRQSRTLSMTSTIFAVVGLRVTGFALIVLAATSAIAVPLHYLFIVAAFVLSAWTISKAVIIEPPQVLTDMISVWSERLQRRFAVS